MKLKSKLILILFLTFGACRKDSINPNDEACQELPREPIAGWHYLVDTPYYTFPFFNPNNPEEIIFQKNVSNSNCNLYKFNLVTKHKQLIFAGENLFQAKWGKNDWILLNPHDANIWKIKSNGDSLTQLTFTNGDFAPEWNITSSKFCMFRSIGAFQKTVIADIFGNEIDTAEEYSGQCSWQHTNLIAETNVYGLKLIDPVIDTVEQLITQQQPRIESAIWLQDGVNLLFTAENGIFKINTQTKNISCIKQSCITRRYLFPTYSSQLNKIIFQRVDQKAINSSTINVSIRLFIMNIDGTGETEIVIE